MSAGGVTDASAAETEGATADPDPVSPEVHGPVREQVWGRGDRLALVALIVMAAFALSAFIFATVQVS